MIDKAMQRTLVRRQAFTLTEMLVVLGIISFLMAFMLGVTSALQEKARRDATKTLIGKIETELENYRERLGYYPQELLDVIPRAADLPTTTTDEMAEANRAVAAILRELDEFSTAGGAHARDIVEYPEGSGEYYVVDAWLNMDRPEHDVNGSDGMYSFLNIVKDGFNRPGFDISSNGPDGENDRDPLNDLTKYGDDVVNWGRR